MFDNNKDDCHRLTHAYCPLLDGDKSWTQGTHNMSFVACSGSVLGDINEGRPGRPPQIGQIPSVDILTLTIGGNNLGFSDVLRNCIYHPDYNTDYGKEYPDPDGLCFKSIAQARLYLTGFFVFIRGTVQGAAEAQRPNDWDRDDFDLFLFLTGYAHFFNVDTTDCNDWSFGAWPVPGDQHHPKLTKELREAINGLVHTVNDMYRMVPGSFDRRWTHTSFVDISPGFQGHRFCEPGVSLYDNYYSSDVWLWNLSPNTPSDWKDPNKPESDTTTYPQPNNALDRDWALFLDNLWIIRPEGLSYDINPGQGSYAHPSPEGSSGWPGLGTRIFHPKQVYLTSFWSIEYQVLTVTGWPYIDQTIAHRCVCQGRSAGSFIS